MEDAILAFDFGSDSIVCSVGRPTQDNKVELLFATYSECKKGLKGGIVTSILAGTNTVKKILDEIDKELPSLKIESVYVGVRGTHISSLNNHGVNTITRSDKEITSNDVISAIENAKAIHLPNEREIIHTIPQDFIVDKERGFSNPVGMEGNIIETDVHIITGNVSHLNNISKVIANAGLSLTEHVYHAFPLAEMVISEEEKKLGSALVDIGDLLTSIVIYHDGKIRFSKELPVGGFHITNDIALALHVSYETAKTIKENYAYAMSSLIDDNKEFEITLVDRITKRKVTQEMLTEYIKPRLEEILLYIKKEITQSGYDDIVNSIIITGGGNLLKGMNKAFEKVFKGKEVRYGNISEDYVIIKDKKYAHQRYTTAISLLCYPIFIRPMLDDFIGREDDSYFLSIVKWFKNLFS